MKNIIFYFSGTGNSLLVAKHLRDNLENSELYSIFDYDKGVTVGDSETNIGFVFPVYFFGLPRPVIRFIERLSIHADAYCYSVNTKGGLSGNFTKQLSDILSKKGDKLSYGASIKMPGNYIIEYSGQKEDYVEKTLAESYEKLSVVIEDIKNRKETEIKNEFRFFSKLAIKYLYKPEKFNGGFTCDDSCIHCGTCEKVCHFNNVNLVDGKPEWSDHCEHCMACIQWCPVKAINYKGKTQNRRRYNNPQIKVNEIIDKNLDEDFADNIPNE